MDIVANWHEVTAFFLPLVIAAIIRQGWGAELKSLVAFAACVIVGLGTAYVNEQLVGVDWHSFKSVFAASLEVLVISIASYVAIWKPTGVAKAIETRT